MKKWIFGTLISAIAVYFLLSNFDVKEFSRIEGKIRWEYAVLFWITSLWSFFPFSYRWFLLLDNKITVWSAYASSLIGVGLNMVLPARGGDVVRLVMNKKDSGLPLPNLISKLFLEKVMDLGAVVILGAFAFLFLGIGSQKNLALVFVSGSVIFGMIVVLILIRFYLKFVLTVGEKAMNLVRLGSVFEEKLKDQIIEFSEFLRGDKLAKPLAISFPTWILGYALNYYIAGQMIGMDFSFFECMLFIFVGAMGVAIPSAPSGIGVFHASIISGFILLGKDGGEGFVYATVVHLSQFIVTTTSALVVYFIYQKKSA